MQRLRAALKAFTLTWGRATWWGNTLALGGTSYDYAAAAGDGRSNAIVVACLEWIVRTWPEAPLGLYRRESDGDQVWLGEHPLTQLLERPNPFYSRTYLWAGTLLDYFLNGNAYWWKNRSGAGRVVELWWLPAELVEPEWPEQHPDVFISHYAYVVNGERFVLPRADVVHFRHGVNPLNPRKGYSKLAALLREVATDNEAANWTASLLRNMAIPGAVVTPGPDTTFDAESAAQMKLEFSQRFGGDRRGEPIVLGDQASVTMLGFSPEQMAAQVLRRVPEERISAVFGTPAVVVGLGAGLDRSTFANYSEAREAAYESTIMPLQMGLADDLQAQLVPDFADEHTHRAGFDISKVRILQEDRSALYEREAKALQAGAITVNEFRSAVGKAEIPQGNVFFVQATINVVQQDALGADVEPEAPQQEPLGPRALPEAAGVVAGEHKAAEDVTDADLERWRARGRALGLEAFTEAVVVGTNGNGAH